MRREKKMGNILYGDGIQDDTKAIQALLDTRKSLVYLPAPKVCYLISGTLYIHSNQELRLDRFATVKLASGSDCIMLSNASEDDKGNENILVTGGIWDMNNMGQSPNPIHVPHIPSQELPTYGSERYGPRYLGVAMRFQKVKNFFIKALTVKDPVTFGIQMACITQFTVDDITFDYRQGNPQLRNMDGVHLDGYCYFGRITNLKGTCFDDLLALNADDGWRGPIGDIEVDGIFSDKGHSAVRMLSAGSPVRRISVSNVFGTYYQYCIALSKYFDDYLPFGEYDQISLRNIYAAKAFRYPDFYTADDYVYPLIWIEKELRIGHLVISELHRREEQVDISTIYIGENTSIKNMAVTHSSYTNDVGCAPFIENHGAVEHLYMRDTAVPVCPLIENMDGGKILCGD